MCSLIGLYDDTDALNDLVAQLWPNIDVAGSQMIKEIVDPMFKTMLPAPMSSLHFTKVELGNVPIRLTNVTSIKLENGAIELDMNVDWEGKCDIELEADYMPGLVSIDLTLRCDLSLASLLIRESKVSIFMDG